MNLPEPWMVQPPAFAGCPKGLEYLAQLDRVLIHQQVEMLEAFTGWETKNKYAIKNVMGQQMYFAMEDSDIMSRQCLGANRGFAMNIVNNFNQEVIRVDRPFKCCGGCCCPGQCQCCAHELTVAAGAGGLQLCGTVVQTYGCYKVDLQVRDANGKAWFTIEAPMMCCMCFSDIQIPIYTVDNRQQIGTIVKEFGGIVKEHFTDSDNFSVNFPANLDVKLKAVLMGATFLIDFMLFENNEGNRKN